MNRLLMKADLTRISRQNPKSAWAFAVQTRDEQALTTLEAVREYGYEWCENPHHNLNPPPYFPVRRRYCSYCSAFLWNRLDTAIAELKEE